MHQMQIAFARYRETVLNVWRSEHGSDATGFKRMPLLAPAPTCERIEVLTVGMNPSYLESVLEDHCKEVHSDDRNMLLRWPSALQWNVLRTQQEWDAVHDGVARLDAHARKNYPSYYKPLEVLVGQAGAAEAWFHIDLFPLRETNQKEFVASIPIPRKDAGEMLGTEWKWKLKSTAKKKKSSESKWDNGVAALFEASIQLIADLQPKVVVALNSYASRLLEYRLPLTRQANGHRYVNESLLRNGVFLLGSQLSGGATSVYAKERLLADLVDVLQGGTGFKARID